MHNSGLCIVADSRQPASRPEWPLPTLTCRLACSKAVEEIGLSCRSNCGNETSQPTQIGCSQEELTIAPARGPPLWEAAGAEHDSPADPALPPIPAYEFDQRIAW